MNIVNNLLIGALFSAKPSLDLENLRKINLIGYYPELNSLIGCIHDPIWHPEGDVWTHTLMVMDSAAELRESFSETKDKFAFMLGALCHDLGKPYANDYRDSRVRSIMHDQFGVFPTRSLLKKINITDQGICNKVESYVLNHLIPMQLYKSNGKVSDKAIKKLQERIHIPDLAQLTRADHWGRIDDEATTKTCPPADFILERYNQIFLPKR